MYSLGTGCFPLKGICFGGAQEATVWKTSTGSIAITLLSTEKSLQTHLLIMLVRLMRGHKLGMGELRRDGGVQQPDHENETVVVKAGSADVHDHSCLSSRISVVLTVKSSKWRSDELRSCEKPPKS